MGFSSSWHEPIKISKPELSTNILVLCIIAHIMSSNASEKYFFSDDHTHSAEYPMADSLRFNTMISSTTTNSNSSIWLMK
jgi:hypothetical protein